MLDFAARARRHDVKHVPFGLSGIQHFVGLEEQSSFDRMHGVVYVNPRRRGRCVLYVVRVHDVSETQADGLHGAASRPFLD